MAKRGGEIEALREVTREAAREPAPQVDWQRVESKLLSRIESSERSRSGRWVYALVAAAAAVLLVGLGLFGGGDAPQARTAPPGVTTKVIGPDVQGTVNGSELAIGDRVVTKNREIEVDHPGRARWTLAASSSATLADVGKRLTVRLDQGAVVSRVVPRKEAESFAVVTGELRVAVHGTVFRVEKRGDRALVEVTEGVVAVGPASAERTEGWLLRAGDQGSFTLDGRTGTVQRAPTAARDSQTSEVTAPAPTRVTAKRNSPAPAPLPLTPTTGEIERRLDTVASHVARCFDQNTKSGDVRVTARTRMSAKVAPDGSLGALAFDPPLAPDVHQCASGAARSTKFPQSQQGALVERTILLGP